MKGRASSAALATILHYCRWTRQPKCDHWICIC